ncbi:MAG: DUF3341 domain-containing protein [Pirellulales bacterium]
MNEPADNFGLLAEFVEPEALVAASVRVYQEGYRHFEAYSPMPVDGLSEAVGFARSRMPLVVLIGGAVGCLTGYGLQYFISVVDYPLNIGGRPLNSWPSFVPVIFEMTVLFGALGAVLGMLAMNGLPRPHHPLFGVPQFDRATQDRFFLCIRRTDPLFDERATREFLQRLRAKEVIDVPL